MSVDVTLDKEGDCIRRQAPKHGVERLDHDAEHHDALIAMAMDIVVQTIGTTVIAAINNLDGAKAVSGEAVKCSDRSGLNQPPAERLFTQGGADIQFCRPEHSLLAWARAHK